MPRPAHASTAAPSRRAWRRLALAVGAVALALAAATAFVAWRAARAGDRFLAEATRGEGAKGARAIERGPSHRLGEPAASEVRVASAVRLARDVVVDGDRTLVATAGGLLLHAAAPARAVRDGRAPARATHLDGLAALDLTAAGRLGPHLLLGDAAGTLTLVDGDRATPLAIALGRRAPVVDIASAGDVAFVLFRGLGVVALDGTRAVDVGAATGVDLSQATALCVGPAGLAVGDRRGHLFLERAVAAPTASADGALARLDADLPDAPITALACPRSGSLLVGTPLGLYRAPLAGPAAPAALLDERLFVTSLLAGDDALLVATFDDGVYRLDPASGARRAHLLGGHRVSRVRAVAQGGGLGDGALAVEDEGVSLLSGDAVATLPAPAPGLTAPSVTALALAAGRLWVGTFGDGIDLLGPDLRPLAHVPEPAPGPRSSDARDDQINALLFRPDTHELLASTVRGLDAYPTAAPGAPSRVLAGDATTGVEGVAQAALLPSGALALATSRGLTLVDGGRARTLYAFHGLANNHVYAVAARDDLLYAGTLAGVSIVDGATSAVPRPRVVATVSAHGPSSLRAGWVTALAATADGVYVGTYGGGVALLRALRPPAGDRSGAGVVVTVEDVSRPLGRLHVNPGALLVDGATLWVGTLEAGLLAYDLSRHTWRRLARLLPAPDATALLADGDALLVGTSAGLVRLSRRAAAEALLPVADERDLPAAAAPPPIAPPAADDDADGGPHDTAALTPPESPT